MIGLLIKKAEKKQQKKKNNQPQSETEVTIHRSLALIPHPPLFVNTRSSTWLLLFYHLTPFPGSPFYKCEKPSPKSYDLRRYCSEFGGFLEGSSKEEDFWIDDRSIHGIPWIMTHANC